MNDVARGLGPRSLQYRLYTLVKYLTYAFLSVNIYLFLNQEIASASHSGLGSSDISALIQLFSATLDTAAWVMLLLLLELETAIIPDEKLVGMTRLSIHTVRLLCGAVIVFAFLGYAGEWEVFAETARAPALPCNLTGEGWSVLLGFDNFAPLTPETCNAVTGSAVQITGLDKVLASPEVYASARELALVDVINAAAWILVVVVLEIEVRLQLKGGLPDRIQWGMNAMKGLLYTTLAGAAIYWWFNGDFLDFWDAALWLFAFVFIELNVFEWQQELEHEAKVKKAASQKA